jgi:hypothetical protein
MISSINDDPARRAAARRNKPSECARNPRVLISLESPFGHVYYVYVTALSPRTTQPRRRVRTPRLDFNIPNILSHHTDRRDGADGRTMRL